MRRASDGQPITDIWQQGQIPGTRVPIDEVESAAQESNEESE